MKKWIFGLTVTLLNMITLPAFAATSKNYDWTTEIIVVSVLVVGGIVGFTIWVNYNPVLSKVQKEKKEQQRLADQKAERVSVAAANLQAGKKGIVISDVLLGHYEMSSTPVRSTVDGTISYFNNSINWYPYRNSADGWSLRICAVNCLGKTIKYMVFHVRLLNRVNDLALCQVGTPEPDLRVTGPIYSGNPNDWYWENIVYSVDVSKAFIASITVIYADDTKEEINWDRIIAVS